MTGTDGALEALLDPSSIVLVGVSRPAPGKSKVGGYAVLQNLRRGGFAGRISVVHPSGDEIDGIRATRSIAELEPHDVAVIALPAAAAVTAVRGCAERGIKAFVVLSSGFGEAGTPEGDANEAALREVADEYGLAVGGPNSLGVVNILNGAWAGNFAILESTDLRPGGLAIVSQSGAIAGSLAVRASDRGVGISHIVSTGNESVTTAADVITALAAEPRVEVIALYLEGAHDGRALAEACRTARLAGKPVVVFKVGETEVGARAALSHTAKLAGTPALYRGALLQAGAVQVDSLNELVETPMVFLGTEIGRPVRRVCVVSISGGLGAVTADALVRAGLEVPVLAGATQDGLAALELPFGAISNPVDTAGATQRRLDVFALVAEVVGADPGVDALVVPLASRFRASAESTADDLLAAAEVAGIPLYVAWFSGSDNAEFVARLRSAGGVPCFDDIEACVRALRGADLVSRPVAAVPDAGVVVDLGTVDGLLDEAASKALLAEHGLPLPRERHAHTLDEALAAADEVGYPVAVKIVSPDLAHKAAVGGVRLDVADAAELTAAYGEILAAVRAAAPTAVLDGVLVSEMVRPERELLVGVYDDDTFGPVLAVGRGGSRVEELADVEFRLLPTTTAEVENLCRSHVGADRPDVLTEVARVVSGIGDFAWAAREHVRELDVNPLVVTDSGEVRALDAVVSLRR
ncbi:acetate--CoA ligase family protein [Pseudonocardia oroxyli]|uniref:Acyl-CoA synthetase (NDP forming) n=1 Tax=Pseudonocardia oroxyli TaxID=366584 RepID=A0A1G8CZB1_PSEOR|nr:acetate--CoA ligase family protein [Pseudonocardia oroxyli]SDH50821.1 Acyl-CoA synthetase (NDP forming) [Pseudonocardia oroxyli]